jgi:hypothetical protein
MHGGWLPWLLPGNDATGSDCQFVSDGSVMCDLRKCVHPVCLATLAMGAGYGCESMGGDIWVLGLIHVCCNAGFALSLATHHWSVSCRCIGYLLAVKIQL